MTFWNSSLRTAWSGLLVLIVLAGARADDPARILLVATPPDHAYASHMYEFECGVLAKCLEQTEGVTCETAVGWPPEPEKLADLAAIVFYSRPAGEIVLNPDHRDVFLELMQRGAGFTAIHWATGVGYTELADEVEVRELYKNLLGGWFRRPPGDILYDTARLRQVDPKHPLCFGWEEYDIHDEFYLDPVLHMRVRPILQVQVKDRDHTVAWSIERPSPYDGRSVGISLGHFHKTFEREDFRRSLVNAILWTANVEVPEAGAPVALDPVDLQLPPQ
jgi:type 1 glutamine amidotransferase